MIDFLRYGLENKSEIITIYVGEDGSQELAEEMADYLESTYEDVEVEIHEGKTTSLSILDEC